MSAFFRALGPAAFLGVCLAPHSALADELDAAPVGPVVVTGHAGEDFLAIATQTVRAEEIARTVNAVTVEDTVRYLPNLFVRRRHIGDTQAPVTTRTSGVGSSARSLVYTDGVLLSALIGNNNSNASPRWSMVAPAEVEQVQVAYGPFSAAYPGNSIGAVIAITTHTPARFEADAGVTYASQSFKQYGVKDTYPSYTVQADAGDRRGPVWWRLSYAHIDTRSQPLSYVTATPLPQPAASATTVTGGFNDLNRTGQPIAVIGAGGLEHQRQDLAKLKLGWDITPRLQASWLLGYFGQSDDAHVTSFLRDASGAPVYAGTVSLNGASYKLAPSAFTGGLYSLDQAHWMQALRFAGQPSPAFSWKAAASLYDYHRDRQRSPDALPAGLTGGSGAILDMGGTGWKTLDLEGDWRPGGEAAAHALRAGAHYDRYELQSRKFAAADWILGDEGAPRSASLGRTETSAFWLEDRIRLAPPLDLTLGARLEHWRAFDGRNWSATPALDVSQPERSRTALSPKVVLAWRDAGWRASASAGVAYRFPTVTELYQQVTVGPDLRSPDPNLTPERAISTELSVARDFGPARRDTVRLSVVTEDVANALISQSTSLGGSAPVSFVQNIDKVRSQGAELVVEAHDVLTPGLDLSASATYVSSHIARDAALPPAEGKQTPQIPRWRWTAVATWRATPRLTLTAAARYSDRVYGAIDNSDVVSHTYQGFDGYFLADARAVFRLNDRWSAALGVDNLTDRRYYLFHPFPGRTVIAQLSYALGAD
ncbi:MAG TPA: TonB-dependent receptor [Phenylobacterium sp.]|uniref:TonB-dependent receptor n=1 Tax=Phenylobacterium sp. TaxID=1871053 RepID=UPI002B482E18|nr:TonB-dependent receptor [Phenylobacterium sp.]HKR86784.1 TonB-dependent receptor [Phenylobacterium sp.]